MPYKIKKSGTIRASNRSIIIDDVIGRSIKVQAIKNYYKLIAQRIQESNGKLSLRFCGWKNNDIISNLSVGK